jgi:glyoxylate utilization-related uncharacterized protein
MTNRPKQNWSDISTEAMTEAAIRGQHLPEENFKLYLNTYEAGQQFALKAGHEFLLYVVAGACKTRLDGAELRLNESEFVSMDAGSYAFEVLGTESLQLVKVFNRA